MTLDDPIVRWVAAVVPRMQERADELDEPASFPVHDVAALRKAGALAMPLPVEGGGGAGETVARADRLGEILMQVGAGSVAVGRIVEAHYNARHLIARYGTPAQRARVDAEVRRGELFALWVTPERSLRMRSEGGGIRLEGGKAVCSAAGHATRALVTAVDEANATRMLLVPLGRGERVMPPAGLLQGLRASVTSAVDFTGRTVDRDACLGAPGDYLREPVFSTGAWRASAVAAGGLQSLVDQVRAQLRASGRLSDPYQLHRYGEMLIAAETCRLWVRRIGLVAERPEIDPDEAVAMVGLGRSAVETACLRAMQLVQRSLGLAAFRRGNRAERIGRDLATYLRQPAPDAVLRDAAAFMAEAAR